MNSVTTLPKNEIEKATKQFSADTGYTYNARLLHTVDDCVEQYNKAEEVSRIAQSVIKDRMQGDALLKAKKLILPEDWNKAGNLSGSLSKKWSDFLQIVKCSKQQASYLLDFAGYKEAEQNLINEGIEVETIDTASHYREVKKLVDVEGHEAVATTYTQAVEANNGVKPSTAKEVKEVVNTSKNKISSEDLFLLDFPEYLDMESADNELKRADRMYKLIPVQTEQEWKSFYKDVANLIHPDKGGKSEHMQILAELNHMYSYFYKQYKLIELRNNREDDYEEWCEEYGCKPYDWVEDVNA